MVSVGYFAGGISGGIAGWLAMSTPALLIIPLVHFAGRRVEHPKVKAVLEAVVLASAGLLFSAAIPLAQAAIVDSLTLVISLVSIGLMLKTKLDTLWIILAAAATAYAGWAVELFLTGLLSVEVVVECRIPCLSCSDWLVQSYVATRIFPKTVILPSRPIFL